MAQAELTIPVHARDPYKNKTSVEFGFRAKRFEEIRRIIQEILDEKGRCHVLDLGGSEKYWLIGEDFIKANRDKLHFTIINPEPQESKDSALFTFSIGDATDPDLFKGRSFDFVHSNSVIEHVGDWNAIQRFADNTRKGYGLVDFTPKHLTTTLRVVDDVTRRDTRIETLARFTVQAGRPVIEAA